MDFGSVAEAGPVSNAESLTQVLTGNARGSEDKTQFRAEDIFNKLLPYADKLDSEADALLAKIKANLGRCVMLRNIKPGCVGYSTVRRAAQESLIRAFCYFPNAYIALTPHIIEILERDPTNHHDAQKDILYLITRTIKRQSPC
ncbi:uncharacterized protein LOC100678804 [Nasonia vitripennis]|uniref:Uncharacterized protein n=1 Tax=Nasonia vitripennis TaxID=7425 RepID=A0A7M7Q283_NASVI|nr:uncharacterized protein LOC100678804 [Nasonia vitripennis]XP_016837416.1 uncharacterized protein LOC100678804 [Nasonia vitripennis]XP_031780682.1 uncharacterized protein LOC100678804 [Nasonia vitripennis]